MSKEEFARALRREAREADNVIEETSDEGPLVVNVEHLMSYVDEQKAEGNAAYKAAKHSEALAA